MKDIEPMLWRLLETAGPHFKNIYFRRKCSSVPLIRKYVHGHSIMDAIFRCMDPPELFRPLDGLIYS